MEGTISAHDVTDRDAPGLGRAVVVASSVGAILCVVGVGLGMLALGQPWGSSLGLGLFAAFWGGAGFGSMLGGVFWATRAEAAESAAAAPRPTPGAAAASTSAPRDGA